MGSPEPHERMYLSRACAPETFGPVSRQHVRLRVTPGGRASVQGSGRAGGCSWRPRRRLPMDADAGCIRVEG
eukprot:2256962-Alexandrium_andersonii.AAC.1